MGNLFEYIDFHVITAVLMADLILILLVSSNNKKKRFAISNTMKTVMAAIAMLPIMQCYYLSRDAEFNLSAFKNNKTFICKNSDSNTYQVSQANGWKTEKNYFLKDSLMIRADRCEVQD